MCVRGVGSGDYGKEEWKAYKQWLRNPQNIATSLWGLFFSEYLNPAAPWLKPLWGNNDASWQMWAEGNYLDWVNIYSINNFPYKPTEDEENAAKRIIAEIANLIQHGRDNGMTDEEIGRAIHQLVDELAEMAKPHRRPKDR